MELVLSPGRLGGGDKSGSPFQNQEVREWSHVDRLTGMLEHARIETGRWQTRHQGSAQAYGKVTDSRERNSADGNVVQKARRQVEVFQSHGAGGRSVQVFRASQWSSSRVTDSASSSPVSVSMNEAPFAVRNGSEFHGKLQQCGDDQSLAKLSQVSRLCRQINGEIHSSIRLNGRGYKPSVLTDNPGSSLISNNGSPSLSLSSITRKSEDVLENGKKASISLHASSGSGGLGKRSSSNEDLTKSLEENGATALAGAKFARDCKARRSLQAQKSSERTETGEEPPSHPANKLRTYVLGMRREDSDSETGLGSEFTVLNGAATLEDAPASSQCNEYLRPTPIVLKPVAGSLQIQGKSCNATVVHLTSKPNGILPEVDNGVINRSTVSLRSLGSRFSPLRNGDVVKSSAKIVGQSVESLQNSTAASECMIGGSREPLMIGDAAGPLGRPVKRVGFCKTEVHFAAESGKVKIVETDCKPPPSNRFRRRKKGVGLGLQGITPGAATATSTSTSAASTSASGRNLPVVHFGDTSYEKLILGVSNGGGGGGEFEGTIKTGENIEADFHSTRDKNPGELGIQRSDAADEKSIVRNGWAARLKTILQSDEAPVSIDVGNDLDEDIDAEDFNRTVKNKFELGAANVEETMDVDHTFKGHTTTVNLGANVMSKLQKRTNEGKCDTISTGIQLQFNTRVERVRPAEVTDSTVIKSPAKILAPSSVPVFGSLPVSRIPRPLTQAQQSSALKSTRLVMSLNRLNTSFKSIVNSGSESAGEKNDAIDRHGSSFGVSSSRKDPIDRSREDLANNNQPSAKVVSSSVAVISKNEIKPAINFDPGARFAPLRSRLLGEDRRGSRKTTVEETPNDSGENQLQYSSGSEQADEEVRSYMLGSGSRPRPPLLLHGLNFEHSVSTRHRQCSGKTLHETHREHLLVPPSTLAMKKSTDSADRSIIGKIEQKSSSIEDELDIVGANDRSGLPVEEICFEVNGTMEKSCHQRQVNTEKTITQSEGKVVTLDKENNKVLVNIVETHEPATTSRVQEDVQSVKGSENARDLFTVKKPKSPCPRPRHRPRPRSKSNNDKRETVQVGSVSPIGTGEAVKPGVVKHKAKEQYCDKNLPSSTRKTPGVVSSDPTYVNVFDRSCRRSERSAPIYENCQVSRRRRDSGEKRSPKPAVTSSVKKDVKARSSSPLKVSASPDVDSKITKSGPEDEQKLTRGSDTRSKRIVAAPSSDSSLDSVHRSNGPGDAQNRQRDPEAQARSLHNRSTRSSRLHRARVAGPGRESVERYSTNDSNNDKKIVAKEVTEDDAIERLTNPVKGAKDTNDSLSGSRSKKPIEIVYQTAVYNMKNEKLAKASKSKESKTPRYINDLICGGRPKRTSGDARHVKGAAPSLQRSHHKSSSPTNRHWK